jgi:DmsE family decaheme c-type cytochrome
VAVPFAATSPHAAVTGWPGAAEGALACSACHGDPTAHLEAGGGAETIFSFNAGNPPAAASRVCLTCHGDQHPRFLQSAHGRTGLDCSSCHSIHSAPVESRALLQRAQGIQRPMDGVTLASRTCEGCHGDVFTQFQFNERHRLREGILECASCHDPHAPASRTQLGGFKHQQCLDCHTDKGGPFVFEHGSSRTEGCVACHVPHGSPNRHMLRFQRTAELCFSCHAQVPGFHSRFTLETVCTNCHATVHGSNFDPFFLK